MDTHQTSFSTGDSIVDRLMHTGSLNALMSLQRGGNFDMTQWMKLILSSNLTPQQNDLLCKTLMDQSREYDQEAQKQSHDHYPVMDVSNPLDRVSRSYTSLAEGARAMKKQTNKYYEMGQRDGLKSTKPIKKMSHDKFTDLIHRAIESAASNQPVNVGVWKRTVSRFDDDEKTIARERLNVLYQGVLARLNQLKQRFQDNQNEEFDTKVLNRYQMTVDNYRKLIDAI